jgi:hypothetical protein
MFLCTEDVICVSAWRLISGVQGYLRVMWTECSFWNDYGKMASYVTLKTWGSS